MSNSFFKIFSSSNGESSTDTDLWIEAEPESSTPSDAPKDSITKITFTERSETEKPEQETKPEQEVKSKQPNAKEQPKSARDKHDDLPNTNREPLPKKGDNKMQKQRQEPRVEERTRRPRKPESSATPVRSQHTKAKAILGPKTHFRGDIIGQEDIIIQGSFEGSINLENNRLFIGETGTFIGDIYAKSITVNGSVEGELFGKENITINASSKVIGNVKAARVSLEEGAKFKGSIELDFTDEPTARKEPKPAQESTPIQEPVIIPEVTEQQSLHEKINRIEKSRQQHIEQEKAADNAL